MAEKKQDSEDLTLISSKTTIEGKIHVDGSVRIDGKLIGDIVAKANAAVGESGVVEGTVKASNIALAGKVHGTVTAAGKLVLGAKSVTKGELRAARLVVDEGAVFDGQCAMTQQSATPPERPAR